MAAVDVDRFIDHMLDTFGDRLETVTYYEWDEFEIVYSREGALEGYDHDDVERIARDLQMESLGKQVTESRFDHGRLRCRISCFDGGTALNFLLGDGQGLAVTVDGAGAVTEPGFVDRCYQVIDPPTTDQSA